MVSSRRGAAVITPYHAEDLAILQRCHQSCLDQSQPVRHVIVADGLPRAEIDRWDCDHLVLPHSHGDNGNTPRCLGAISAINRGYWPILMLDADNWFEPSHVALAMECKRRQPAADVIVTGRRIVLPDGTPVPGIPEEDVLLQHADTSCFVFYPSSFRALALWGMMPPYLGPVCDRFVFTAIQHFGLTIAWSQPATVSFTAHYSWAYKAVQRPVPDDVHDIDWDLIKAQFDEQQVFERTGIQSWIIGDSPPTPGGGGNAPTPTRSGSPRTTARPQ